MQEKRSTKLQSPTRVPPASGKRKKDVSEETAPMRNNPEQPNGFSRRSLRVRIIMPVYIASYNVPLKRIFFSGEEKSVSLAPNARDYSV